MRSALASFNRLSPSRIVRMRCGGRNGRSTAVAAAASGGATTAPRTIAGAHGIAGTSMRTTTATAAVVRPTAKTTRLVSGSQLSRRSRGDASYAASSRIGATKSASASSGGTVNDGAPGMNASSAPPSARKTGYGAPTRRARPDRNTAARKRPRSCSSSLIQPTADGDPRQVMLSPILVVADLLHPFHGLAVETFLHGDVRHGGRRRGAVPMFFARRDPDHVTRPNLLDRPAQPLRAAAAGQHDQRLAERMRVPRGPGAGLECDAGADHTRRVGCLVQRIEAHRAGEVFGRSLPRRL